MQESSPRLAFRMKTELKERIEQAAALLGVTVTDFVIASLSERASEVLARQQLLTLSDRDRDRFLEAMNRPGRSISTLAETLARHRKP